MLRSPPTANWSRLEPVEACESHWAPWYCGAAANHAVASTQVAEPDWTPLVAV